MWTVYNEPDFNGKKLLLKEGDWDSDMLDPVGNSASSVEKIGI